MSWKWLVVPAAVVVLWAAARAGDGQEGGGPSRSAPSESAGPSAEARADGPERFASEVERYAGRAGVASRLLMAILMNESEKPHEPSLERTWQRFKPDAAFGIANMHKAAFDEAKQGRDFADRDWRELPDDPALAIESAAWYLHDLAARLPGTWPARYAGHELLALGYNAGPGAMLAFARGARPGPTARSYLEKLRRNWPSAAQAVRPA